MENDRVKKLAQRIKEEWEKRIKEDEIKENPRDTSGKWPIGKRKTWRKRESSTNGIWGRNIGKWKK